MSRLTASACYFSKHLFYPGLKTLLSKSGQSNFKNISEGDNDVGNLGKYVKLHWMNFDHWFN